MANEKKTPSIETVQKGFNLSDLLKIKVCNPVKEKIDKIEMCPPNIEDCMPSIKCGPEIFCIPDRFCGPDIICKPIYSCIPDRWCRPYMICTPDIICKPIIPCTPWVAEACGPSAIDPRVGAQEITELTTEMREMMAELKAVKGEIAELKNKLK